MPLPFSISQNQGKTHNSAPEGTAFLAQALQAPMMDLENCFCFGIRQASESPDKLNHNLLLILLDLLKTQCARLNFGF